MIGLTLTQLSASTCPYCYKCINAELLKTRLFRRNHYQCSNCLNIVYICGSSDCNNYVKSEKKSSRFCAACSMGRSDCGGTYDVGGVDSSSNSSEYIACKQKAPECMGSGDSINDVSSDWVVVVIKYTRGVF